MIHTGIAILRQRINQGIKNKRQYVKVPFSKNILKICRLLQQEGLINSIQYSSEYELTIQLKFYREVPVFREMVLVSRPSHYVYEKKKKSFNKKLMLDGITFFTTNKGIFSESKMYAQQLKNYYLKSFSIINKKSYPVYNSFFLDYRDYTKNYFIYINRLFAFALARLSWAFLLGFLYRFFLNKKDDKILNDFAGLEDNSVSKVFKRFRLKMVSFYFQKKYIDLLLKYRFILLLAKKKKKNVFIYKKSKPWKFRLVKHARGKFLKLQRKFKNKNLKLFKIFQKISYSKFLYFIFKRLILVKVKPARRLDKRYQTTYRLGTGGKVLFKIKL